MLLQQQQHTSRTLADWGRPQAGGVLPALLLQRRRRPGAAAAAPREPAPPSSKKPQAHPDSNGPCEHAGARGDSTPGAIPSQEQWSRELRHLQGMLLNPSRPLARRFILRHCYVLNTPASRAAYRALPPADMHRSISDRAHVERRLAAAANALATAWRRLQLLAEAVADGCALLQPEQLDKEREQLVGLRERLAAVQPVLTRAIARAATLGDAAFEARGAELARLSGCLAATAEEYLKTHMRRIAAASRANAAYRQAMQQPQATPGAADAQRSAQLAQLMPLVPEHPTQLLAEYRQAALAFECYQDPALHARSAGTGQPSSTAARFWQPVSNHSSSAGTVQQPGSSPAAGRQVWLDGALAPPQQQPPPQQLASSRPPQQLPLLPHLGRHHAWLAQPQFAAMQREPWQPPEQQEWRRRRAGEFERMQALQLQRFGLQPLPPQPQQLQAAAPASNAAVLRGLVPPPALPAAEAAAPPAHGGDAGEGEAPEQAERPCSLAGQVMPPMVVLLQRALELEQRLVADAVAPAAQAPAEQQQQSQSRRDGRRRRLHHSNG